jgi:hypothetical protein
MANSHISKYGFSSLTVLDVNCRYTIRRNLRVVSGLACFGWFLLLHPEKSTSATVPPIVYEGTISKTVIGADGNPVPATESTYSFRAEIALPLYRIGIVAIKDVSCYEQISGTDGIDSYLLHKSWPSWKDKSANTGYHEVARVTPGLFPTLAVSEIQLVWTMLACQKFLTNEPIVLSHISYAPYDELKMNVQYRENGSSLDLVEVFSSGFDLVQGKKYPLPPPFDKGYKLWEFSVTDIGQLNGFAFPRKGTLLQFSVFTDDPPGKSGVIRNVRQFQIVATNAAEFQLGAESDFLPAVSQANLMATDYRFSPKIPRPNMGEVGAIQYRLRDNKWLNRSNKMVNASGVSLKVETETANLAAKPSGRRLGIIALIVIFSAGVVFFIVKKRRHL